MSDSSTPTVIENTLPARIIAVDDATMQRIGSLTASATAANPTDAKSLADASDLFADIDRLSKDIAASRLEITRPIDQLKKDIIAAERAATGPLEAAKSDLGRRVVACKRELDRIAAEERRRLEEEQRRIVEEARLAREQEEQRQREEAAIFGSPSPAPDPEPVRQVAAQPPPAPPAPVRTSVGTSKRTVVEITDEAALIALACSDGGKIHGKPVLSLDRRAIEAMAKAGVELPGVSVRTEEVIRSRGRR